MSVSLTPPSLPIRINLTLNATSHVGNDWQPLCAGTCAEEVNHFSHAGYYGVKTNIGIKLS